MGYLTVSIFGIEGHTGYRDFTVAAADIYRDLFGIAPEDFYIKFDDITAWSVGSRYEEETLAVARKSGIDEQAFLAAYRDGRAEAALERDFTLTRSMGIHSLPTYLLQCRDKGVLLQSFDMNDFLTAIARITQN